jgi:ribonuclease-3
VRHQLETISAKLGLRFRNIALLKHALTHRSADGENNERLEFLGDSALGFVIAECLYEKFPEADEGTLSRLRANLVNESSLADLARELNLGEYLILGSGELKSGGYRRDSILSDALEAVMGAIAKDQGIGACREWILNLFARHIAALSLQNWKKDPKTRLQELMQARRLELPEYRLKAMIGEPHQQSFCVECRVPVLPEATEGIGSSRKRAEQQAAEKILVKLAAQAEPAR